MSVAISVDDRVPCIVGILSRTTLTRYKQVIEVKNTHKHEIRLLVEDQLPRSENQKIKASCFIYENAYLLRTGFTQRQMPHVVYVSREHMLTVVTDS